MSFKYEKTISAIKIYILENNIAPESRLPSIRKFAEMFGVSRHTAYLALEELSCAGIVEAKQRTGYFLLESGWHAISPNRLNWKKYIDDGWFYNYDDDVGFFDKDELTLLDFRVGQHHGGARLVTNAAKKTGKYSSHMYNQDIRGLPELRKAICSHVKAFGINAEPDNVLITEGTTTAVNVIQMSLLRMGDIFIYDQYMMPKDQPAFISMGLNYVPVPIDHMGVINKNLIHLLKNKGKQKRYIVCSAMGGTNPFADKNNHGYPDMERRMALLTACSTAGVPFIELDRYRELYTNKAPVCMKGIDKGDTVIYMSGLTDSFMNTLRTSWIIGNHKLIDKLANVHACLVGRQDAVSELTSLILFESGDYFAYNVKLKQKLLENKVNTQRIFKKHLHGLADWNLNGSGYMAYLKFNDNVNVLKMYSMRKDYIQFFPSFLIHKDYEKIVNICLAAHSPERLDKAIEKLAILAEKSIIEK